MMTAYLSVALAMVLVANPTAQPAAAGTGEPATAPGAVPTNVATIIRRQCSGCHDADSVLDLRKLPGAHETKTWNDILQSLQTGRMPMSLKEAAAEWKGPEPMPPPFDPVVRQELVNAIAAMLEPPHAPEPPRTQLQLSHGEWLLIVREVALPFMTEEELGALIAPRRELASQAQPHLIAGDVCGRIVDIDLGKPAKDRKLLQDLPAQEGKPPSDATVEGLVRQTFSLVYQQEPTAKDLVDGGARFRRFLGVTSSTKEAAVALCTSYLAGVRVRRLEFASPLSREVMR